MGDNGKMYSADYGERAKVLCRAIKINPIEKDNELVTRIVRLWSMLNNRVIEFKRINNYENMDKLVRVVRDIEAHKVGCKELHRVINKYDYFGECNSLMGDIIESCYIRNNPIGMKKAG